MLQLGNSVLI